MKHNVRSIRLLIIRLLMAFMLAATVALFSVAPTSGQTRDAESGESVRVMARLAEDGRVEFGLRTSTGNQFPSGRFFPTTVTHENWLVSTSLTIVDDTQVRIIARRDGETRLEFGVRIDDPAARLFATGPLLPAFCRRRPLAGQYAGRASRAGGPG